MQSGKGEYTMAAFLANGMSHLPSLKAQMHLMKERGFEVLMQRSQAQLSNADLHSLMLLHLLKAGQSLCFFFFLKFDGGMHSGGPMNWILNICKIIS